MRLSAFGLGLFVLLAVLPLLLGLGYALLYSLGLVGVLGQGFTLDHWGEVLAGGALWRSLGHSLYLAVSSMGLATGLALWLALRGKHAFIEGWLGTLIYFPLTLPAMVMAFFVLQLLGQAGLLARVVAQLGWITEPSDFPSLVNDAAGMGIILCHVLMATPFLLILFLNLYRSERLPELTQLAGSLGARKGQIRRRIEVPVLLRAAYPTLVLYFLFTLGSYEIPLLLGREDPQMVSVLIERKLMRYNLADKPEAYVVAVIYAGLALGLVGSLLGRSQRI